MINKDNSRILREEIDRRGLKKAWASILATHVSSLRDDLAYILKNDFFRGAKRLSFDILSGLSIGEMSALYEFSVAYHDHKKRAQDGQYFTPDDIAKLMAKYAMNLPNATDAIWLDPCSGIGNLSFFLIQAQKEPENFLKKNLYLIDKDPLALFVARVLLVTFFQKEDGNLFKKIENRFIVADFLGPSDLPEYDYAILNPPYVIAKKDARFLSASARNTYAYFLEKIIDRSNGFVSITPQNFTYSKNYSTFRFLLLEKFKNINIFCFDNVPDNVFKGFKFGSQNTNTANSTRAAITIAFNQCGKPLGSSGRHYITHLMRWRSRDRAKFLESMEKFLVPAHFSEKMFPKLYSNLVDLYKESQKWPMVLGDIVSREETKYKLTVPSTPRYFIPALKTKVSRTSQKTLYFKDENLLDLAYLLLNSSYMYWWWRMHDGGMSISDAALLSLPIPENIKLDKKLINRLEKSEKENKVFKLNAQKIIENVKHDEAIIMELNKSIFPRFYNELARIHSNNSLNLL